MIHLLETTHYDRVRPLFGDLDFHLGLLTVLEGRTPGCVYVDAIESPQSALLRRGRRFYLAGSADNPLFNAGLRELFCEQVYPQAQQAGEIEYVIYPDSQDWEIRINEILKDKHLMRAQRQYYEFKPPQRNWRALIFPGLTIRPVDTALLKDEDLKNLNDLRHEMASECPSVEAFMESQFGVCAIVDGEIAAWCLSEYSHGERCEIGIETLEAFQKRGIGTILTGALVEQALARGIQRIGWDCYTNNLPSAATALKAGFEKVHDYAVYFAWFDEAANLAVNGNICLWDDRFEEALDWYEQAIRTGKAPDWVKGMVEKARAGLNAKQA